MMLSIYAPFDSPRLRYVLNWVLKERLGLEYSLTHDEAAPVQLSYGKENAEAVFFPESGLLSLTPGLSPKERGDRLPTLDFDRLGISHLNTAEEVKRITTLDFDVFAAIFFLLSRAEEYIPFEADGHGRYPAKYSVLSQKGWLQTPVVDIWVEKLRQMLAGRFGIDVPKPTFSFQPTYDIDIAYSYLHKGFRRSLGGLLRDAKKGNFPEISARIRTLSGKKTDPYDAFGWLRSLHAQFDLKPVYFVLAAAQSGPFDKNISPQQPAMKALAQGFAMEGTAGIHPSYTTSEFPEKVMQEKGWLEAVTGKQTHHSRQHYIRLRFPQTYRQLLAASITDDWSMGYPDALGFRAGTSHPFLWYDLEKETPTALRIHPFCFMDTTARDYLGLSAAGAFEQLENFRKILLETGGKMTTVVHNFSLGTARDWPGWREGYLRFVEET